MYHIYLSTSGLPSLHDINNFSLTAMLIKTEDVNTIFDELLELREDDQSFLVSDIVRERNYYEGYNIDDRMEFLVDHAKYLGSAKIITITVMVDKGVFHEENYSHKFHREWIEGWTYKLLFERINSITQEYSIIVKRGSDAHNTYIKNLLEEIENILELIFVPDNDILQMTQFVAWILRRYYSMKHEDGKIDETVTELFRIIVLVLGDKYRDVPKGERRLEKHVQAS